MSQIVGNNIADFVRNCENIVVKLRKLRSILVLVVCGTSYSVNRANALVKIFVGLPLALMV